MVGKHDIHCNFIGLSVCDANTVDNTCHGSNARKSHQAIRQTGHRLIGSMSSRDPLVQKCFHMKHHIMTYREGKTCSLNQEICSFFLSFFVHQYQTIYFWTKEEIVSQIQCLFIFLSLSF